MLFSNVFQRCSWLRLIILLRRNNLKLCVMIVIDQGSIVVNMLDFMDGIDGEFLDFDV